MWQNPSAFPPCGLRCVALQLQKLCVCRWMSSSPDCLRVLVLFCFFSPACPPHLRPCFRCVPSVASARLWPPPHTDFTVSLSSAGFGGGPGFGGVGTGGSSFAFSSTSKPTGGSLSAGTVRVGVRVRTHVILLRASRPQLDELPVAMLRFSQLRC